MGGQEARFEQAVKTLQKSTGLEGRGQTTGFADETVEGQLDLLSF